MTAFVPKAFESMRRNRDVLFLIVNALGWTMWGLGQFVNFKLFEAPDYQYARLMSAAAAVTGFVLTIGLRYVCRVLWHQRPTTMILAGFVVAFLFTLPFRVVINLLDDSLSDKPTYLHHWYDFFMGFTYSSYLMIGWMGVYFAIHFYEANQRERETALRATALAQSAQLKMLRYQLNPHFLFNTLNAVSTLVLDEKNAIANTVVTRLADFLRYTLDQDPMKTVTLAQEVAALNLYLEIEKMRFGSRLQVELDIEPEAGTVSVPSLLIQPLIENAIKYAIAPREQGGRIRIAARASGQDVILTVDDDGPGLVDTARIDSGRGVGLRNTRERLRVMYGARAQISLANNDPGLRVALQFPQHP